MTLYPNIPFSEGDIFTPELAYLAFNQVYDGQTQYLGHHAKITDAELSDATGSVLNRVTLLTDSLSVTKLNTNVIRISSGVIKTTSGELLVVPAQSVALADGVKWVQVDNTGEVLVTSSPILTSVLLAKIGVVGGNIDSIIDYRDKSVYNVTSAERVYRRVGGSSLISKVTTDNEIFDQGEYSFRDLTVPAGTTLLIEGSAVISCSGNVQIDGDIVVPPTVGGAVGAARGLVQNVGFNPTGGSGLGGTGRPYPWYTQPYGSGGGGAYMDVWQSSGSLYHPSGGSGGGGLTITAAGKITVTGSIRCNGGNGGSGTNAFVGGEPVAPNGLVYSSISGTGGGSGGLINLTCLDSLILTSSAVLEVLGGLGGNAFAYLNPGLTGSITVSGGSGGGGGYIVLRSPDVNTTGSTVDVSGGMAGVPAGFDVEVAPNVYEADADIGGGVGGGYAGASISNDRVLIGNKTRVTRVASGEGKVIISSEVPIT